MFNAPEAVSLMTHRGWIMAGADRPRLALDA
jgi:hypothetical protein